ncbi:anti-sigma F factor antagonist [Calderihabitans maritimus]|uniref:Anti-sigma F factor antagonist n=1 Tax=Calderihabitans maritimus TaxID=1246530 RepID=A0A1Z5HP98_9FIRM|nr:anti-sigma F factor antagonist [Calderihabitans maritimus]GAW91349.1 Anti-sigma F factor antagonist [Calderihabitans maritimus]
MDLKLSRERDVLIVDLQGELDLLVADNFRSEIDRCLEEWPVRNLLLDLKEVTFIDSSGLGVILGRYKKVTERGGKVLLTGARPQIKKILELSGLLKIMPHYDTIQQGMDELA